MIKKKIIIFKNDKNSTLDAIKTNIYFKKVLINNKICFKDNKITFKKWKILIQTVRYYCLLIVVQEVESVSN